MKRIYAVTMVKNESDVIESFCRHTLSFCDGILVCDDGSADGTREILKRLAAEGLPVILSDNLRSIGFYPGLVINRLAKTAADSYGAELILPFDADEFLYSTDGENPRRVLEELSDTETYWLNWPFYLPSNTPKENGVFLPSYFEEYVTQPKIKKVMVGAALLSNPKNRISEGNQVLYKAENHSYWEPRQLSGLNLAHYPVRSAEQITAKAIVGWANALCTNRPEDVADNWREMYLQIKRHGFPNAERLREFAMTYTYGYKQELPVSRFRLKSDITLRYTDYEKRRQSFFNIVLENYERIIQILMTSGFEYSLSESVREAKMD